MSEQEREPTDAAESAPPPAAAPEQVAAPEQPATEPVPAPHQDERPPSEGRAETRPNHGERGEGRAEGRGGDDRGERGGDRRRRHFGRRKVCTFCVDKVQSIDYKDSMRLRRFLSDRARIEPRRKTGTCAKHQRWLAVALKRARHLALLPYSPEHIRITGVFAGRR